MRDRGDKHYMLTGIPLESIRNRTLLKVFVHWFGFKMEYFYKKEQAFPLLLSLKRPGSLMREQVRSTAGSTGWSACSRWSHSLCEVACAFRLRVAQLCPVFSKTVSNLIQF